MGLSKAPAAAAAFAFVVGVVKPAVSVVHQSLGVSHCKLKCHCMTCSALLTQVCVCAGNENIQGMGKQEWKARKVASDTPVTEEPQPVLSKGQVLKHFGCVQAWQACRGCEETKQEVCTSNKSTEEAFPQAQMVWGELQMPSMRWFFCTLTRPAVHTVEYFVSEQALLVSFLLNSRSCLLQMVVPSVVQFLAQATMSAGMIKLVVHSFPTTPCIAGAKKRESAAQAAAPAGGDQSSAEHCVIPGSCSREVCSGDCF